MKQSRVRSRWHSQRESKLDSSVRPIPLAPHLCSDNAEFRGRSLLADVQAGTDGLYVYSPIACFAWNVVGVRQ